MFVKNAWYVAGWSHEIGRMPLERWIIGEPVVLYRTEAGRAVALEDRCAHRRGGTTSRRWMSTGCGSITGAFPASSPWAAAPCRSSATGQPNA
jgi:nitrite reductase/ring-hydroxylating ferredoxin subunit